jgi:hypothetical protein
MVYLLHFSQPIAPGRHTAQHYIGFTEDLERRIAEHRAGTGSRLCEVAKERGISFVVAQLWEGDRTEERRLKRRKEGPRLCPICTRVHDAQLDIFLSFTMADVEPLAL